MHPGASRMFARVQPSVAAVPAMRPRISDLKFKSTKWQKRRCINSFHAILNVKCRKGRGDTWSKSNVGLEKPRTLPVLATHTTEERTIIGDRMFLLASSLETRMCVVLAERCCEARDFLHAGERMGSRLWKPWIGRPMSYVRTQREVAAQK